MHETVQAQQAGIAELNVIVARRTEHILELEEEVTRLRGEGSSE